MSNTVETQQSVEVQENSIIIKNLDTDSEITHTEKYDPYAYLQRDFSSENYKIEIKNLPKHYGISEFRKLLNEKLNLSSNKIKTPRRNSPYAFVCFRNESDRENALKIITGYKWKGKILTAIKAKPAPDPLVRKRKIDGNDEESKKTKFDNRPIAERLKASTIPFWNVPYKEQLERKQDEIKKILTKLGNDISHSNSYLQPWIQKQKELHDGLPCELLDIRFSEQYDGYRNKCEFTVGLSEEDKLPTVGFRIGSYVNGVTGVGPIDELPHIPDAMKLVVKCYENFVRSCNLEIFNPETQVGNLRQFTVRCAQEQLMIIIGIHPQNMSQEQLENFKLDVVKYFSEGEGKKAGVTSMYYQAVTKKSSGEGYKFEHLYGDTHIYETILGLKFRISPQAFFQINTPGAEVLYKSAIELADPRENCTVVDICCGTGTIGLCFSKHCDQILGLEVVPQAIDDAKENAKLNNIENGEFFTGKAEDMLLFTCKQAKYDNVIGIVDPPRAGLHHKAIVQLRKVKNLTRLIYMSCNPSAAAKNFVDLARPISKTLQEDPFVPVKAVAVDMFPYTPHCELIICFERWDKISNV